MEKKALFSILAGAAVVIGIGTAVYQMNQSSQPPAYQRQMKLEENPTVQSNFYQYVNKDWLEKAKISKNNAEASVSQEVQDKIDKNLQKDLKNLAAGKEKTNIEGMDSFLDYYKLAYDFNKRSADGTEPLKPYLNEIEALSSFADLNAKAAEFQLKGIVMPFNAEIGKDFRDKTKKLLVLSAPSSIFGDSSQYQDEALKKHYLSVFSESVQKLMVRVGYSKDEAQKLAADTLAFDQLIAPQLLSNEEASDEENLLAIKSRQEFAAYSDQILLDQFLDSLVGQQVDQVNIAETKYFESLQTLLVPENFEIVKSWMLVMNAMADAPYLDQETANTADEFERFLSGVDQPLAKEDSAFRNVTELFFEPISIYYGQKYFGLKAKKEVTDMTDHIIAVYKERLKNNTWLSDETKHKAVKKLDALTYQIGYPEKVSQFTKQLSVDTKQSLLVNYHQLLEQSNRYDFSKFNEPFDASDFPFVSYEVNASYDPSENSIMLPAGILQAPFYSKDQSAEENYGAIGAVIGHEITHAFDSNGAQYDENGNRVNWWNENDYQAFEVKTQDMIKQWDGLPYQGGKVNGKLTVSENIADAGGLSAALEALEKQKNNVDYQAFFANYARSWRAKMTKESIQERLLSDVHALDELRVNMPLKNMDAFYKTYSVKKGDPMYLPKEDRISIW